MTQEQIKDAETTGVELAMNLRRNGWMGTRRSLRKMIYHVLNQLETTFNHKDCEHLNDITADILFCLFNIAAERKTIHKLKISPHQDDLFKKAFETANYRAKKIKDNLEPEQQNIANLVIEKANSNLFKRYEDD